MDILIATVAVVVYTRNNYINNRNGGHFTRADINRTAAAKVDQGQRCWYNIIRRSLVSSRTSVPFEF